MRLSQVQLLVGVLCSSVLLGRVSGAPRRDTLEEALSAAFITDKDLARLLLLRFASALVEARGDQMFPQLAEEEERARGAVVVRPRHLSLTQRERKAGCRNFFWKTFTSC